MPWDAVRRSRGNTAAHAVERSDPRRAAPARDGVARLRGGPHPGDGRSARAWPGASRRGTHLRVVDVDQGRTAPVALGHVVCSSLWSLAFWSLDLWFLVSGGARLRRRRPVHRTPAAETGTGPARRRITSPGWCTGPPRWGRQAAAARPLSSAGAAGRTPIGAAPWVAARAPRAGRADVPGEHRSASPPWGEERAPATPSSPANPRTRGTPSPPAPRTPRPSTQDRPPT